ncbi:PREDICTED: probable serine/threonine-protein kinase kinX [Branchiostoma belcheri]|uniref:Probable serine/threonine-protein kinase kinX n=1 Tax=Branchiostoma belcheri TaxID=7741 RepID=A0A6P4YWA9_BRABE|nr:PREDICTED: probable serine/threonine-protein kinase kinX [Branchiostoma belcheri]
MARATWVLIALLLLVLVLAVNVILGLEEGAKNKQQKGDDANVKPEPTKRPPEKENQGKASKKTEPAPGKDEVKPHKKTEDVSVKGGQEEEVPEEDTEVWPPNGVTLEDDPSLWPGHLEPIGSNAPVKRVDARKGFPSPKVFLEEYAISSVPVLFKGAMKDSVAHRRWNSDDYLRTFPESATEFKFVETKKKENRTQPVTEMTLRQFLDRYATEDIYMVQAVPEFLKKDVPMPKPLLCEPFIEMLQDTVLWFSSGGTRSVLHHDNLDNINCLLDGRKELVFISYQKYKKKVPKTHPEDSYSSLDVDAVDFTEYPGMREVEYYRVNMTAGDCLYVPYMWFHQVNSYERNIAVNIFWDHDAKKYVKMLSQTCGDAPDDPTLADFDFKVQETETENSQDLLTHFVSYLPKEKEANLTFRQFEGKLKKDGLISKLTNWTDECTQAAQEMFDQLDQNGNFVFAYNDLDDLTREIVEDLNGLLQDRILDLNEIADDQDAELKEALAVDVGKKQMDRYSEQIKKMIDDQLAAMLGKKKPSAGLDDKTSDDSYSSKEEIKDKFREKQKQKEEERRREELMEDEFTDFAVVEEEEEEEELLAEDEDEEVTIVTKASKETKDDASKSKVSKETKEDASKSKVSKETKDDASKSKVSKETKGDASTSKVSKETKDDATKSKVSKETKGDASTSKVSKETKGDASKSKVSMETKDDASKSKVSMETKDDASKSKVSKETKDDASKSKVSKETKDDASKSKVSKETKDDASKSTVSKETIDDASKSKVSKETKEDASKSKVSKETKDDASKSTMEKKVPTASEKKPSKKTNTHQEL